MKESRKKSVVKKKQDLEGTESVSRLLNLAFGCLGYPKTDAIRQIGTSIANIGQQIGNFRNEIGSTSHGRTIEELKTRNDSLNILTSDFLILSIELICCFLIEAFESDNPLTPVEKEVVFEEEIDFNNYWDDMFDEYKMNYYSYSASEVLYNCDPNAYKVELNNYKLIPEDEANN